MNALATLGVDAFGHERARHANPQPLRAARSAPSRSPAPARGALVASAGSCAGQHVQGNRRILDRARERDRSDRATRRTRAARSATRARRSASGPRGRRAPPAGGSIRPCPSRATSGAMPAATATAEPPLDPPGIRSVAQGLRAGPNAEFSFDEPIANSSQFVLPTMTAPAASSLRDGGGVVRRNEVLEDLRRCGRADAASAEVVLQRDRHAGQRQGRAIRVRHQQPPRALERPFASDGVERVRACRCASRCARALRYRHRPPNAHHAERRRGLSRSVAN